MKTKATLLFQKCLQNAQEYGSDDEFMVSRIFFSLELPDKRIDDLYVDIKQAQGDKFEGGSIEVGKPHGYAGNLDYEAFRNAVESYFRKLVGSTGAAIKIQGGNNIRMFNNWFHVPMKAEITIDTDSNVQAW